MVNNTELGSPWCKVDNYDYSDFALTYYAILQVNLIFLTPAETSQILESNTGLLSK